MISFFTRYTHLLEREVTVNAYGRFVWLSTRVNVTTLGDVGDVYVKATKP